MQRFEHKSQAAPLALLDKWLGIYDQQGWELVAITNGKDPKTRILFFKRPYNWPHSDTLAKG